MYVVNYTKRCSIATDETLFPVAAQAWLTHDHVRVWQWLSLHVVRVRTTLPPRPQAPLKHVCNLITHQSYCAGGHCCLPGTSLAPWHGPVSEETCCVAREQGFPRCQLNCYESEGLTGGKMPLSRGRIAAVTTLKSAVTWSASHKP